MQMGLDSGLENNVVEKVPFSWSWSTVFSLQTPPFRRWPVAGCSGVTKRASTGLHGAAAGEI